MKFKATVVFEGSETSMYLHPPQGDPSVSDCPRLNEWMVDRGVGRLTPRPILHLFDYAGKRTALCKARPKTAFDEVAPYVDGGRKYKVCLACRKVAEGEGE
jgi:hypothetical protein